MLKGLEVKLPVPETKPTELVPWVRIQRYAVIKNPSLALEKLLKTLNDEFLRDYCLVTTPLPEEGFSKIFQDQKQANPKFLENNYKQKIQLSEKLQKLLQQNLQRFFLLLKEDIELLATDRLTFPKEVDLLRSRLAECIGLSLEFNKTSRQLSPENIQQMQQWLKVFSINNQVSPNFRNQAFHFLAPKDLKNLAVVDKSNHELIKGLQWCRRLPILVDIIFKHCDLSSPMLPDYMLHATLLLQKQFNPTLFKREDSDNVSLQARLLLDMDANPPLAPQNLVPKAYYEFCKSRNISDNKAIQIEFFKRSIREKPQNLFDQCKLKLTKKVIATVDYLLLYELEVIVQALQPLNRFLRASQLDFSKVDALWNDPFEKQNLKSLIVSFPLFYEYINLQLNILNIFHSILAWAIVYKKTEIACELLSLNINLQYSDPECINPIFAAVHANDPEMILLLLAKGACISQRREYEKHQRFSPLMVAVKLKNLKMIEFLLANGADPLQTCSVLESEGYPKLKTTNPFEFAKSDFNTAVPTFTEHLARQPDQRRLSV